MSLLSNSVVCFPNVNPWIGALRLYFRLFNDKSFLVRNWHYGPFCVQKTFYSEDGVPQVYLLHPPGGLVGGDQLDLKVYLGVGSHALLTMPGSTKFYRSNGSYVYLKQQFYLEKDSVLEWLPQSSIFFPKSRVIIDTELIFGKGSRCIFFDMLCFGRSACREGFKKGILNAFLSISSEDFIGLRERIRIDNSDELNLFKLSGCQISAIFFAMPSNISILHDVRMMIKMYNIKMGGVTLLDNLLIVRLLDNDDEMIQTLLRDLWYFLRPIVIGKESVIPRGWSV